MSLITCRIKPYIQPFERQLALAELRAITHRQPQPVDGSLENAFIFSVESVVSARMLAGSLAYWEAVGTDDRQLTRQVCLEATVNVCRNGIPVEEVEKKLPFVGEPALPNRRYLRYGSHGIHEYRGKFFPQLARALMNIAGGKQGMVVADPMCGSGTALVEAVLAGHRALGLDLNPLSVLLSHVKCSLLAAKPKDLLRAYQRIRDRLLSGRSTTFPPLQYFDSLPEADGDYLDRWFSRQVLEDLDQVAQAIQAVPAGCIRDLLRLSLSNILRRVSWQKKDDLRVRKEVRPDEEIDPLKEFLDEFERSVRLVLAFLKQNHNATLGSFLVQEGDARSAARTWKKWLSKVDVIITSPPYATALPYLDTDRLSLVYLRLLRRGDHRSRDQEMIGNREITTKTKDVYWQMFQEKRPHLPGSITTLVAKIDRLNRAAPVGFRRQNLPSLLAKYFIDMRAVFENMNQLLKPGAPAYVVVGNNHTTAGNGRHIAINTADLLVDLAEKVGFESGKTIPMEMLVSRDIFRKNAVASEYILCLRKPGSKVIAPTFG